MIIIAPESNKTMWLSKYGKDILYCIGEKERRQSRSHQKSETTEFSLLLNFSASNF